MSDEAARASVGQGGARLTLTRRLELGEPQLAAEERPAGGRHRPRRAEGNRRQRHTKSQLGPTRRGEYSHIWHDIDERQKYRCR